MRFYIAFTILIIIGLFLTFCWFSNENLNDNSQCIIGYIKKSNGIFYNGCLDIFHILHLILYIIIGIIYPNNYGLILLISILWELYENFMFKYFVKKSKCKNIICLRFEDIILNIIGYYIGTNIYNHYHSYKNNKNNKDDKDDKDIIKNDNNYS